jgi:hypothetical protein
MDWLTTDLEKRVKEVFEKRYKRQLKKDEIREIALNLSSLTEVAVKTRFQLRNEGKT